MLTEIVFPKRRGVEMSISCGRLSQPLNSRMRLWSRANCPGGAVFQKTRAHERMNCSWNCFWWKERSHPRRSSASSAPRQRAMRDHPSGRAACRSAARSHWKVGRSTPVARARACSSRSRAACARYASSYSM
jgi:hypothetical protein